MNKYAQILNKIHVHPLLWFISAIAIMTANFRNLLFLLLIIFIHELAHTVVAIHYGWRIKRITLLPFGGIAEVEENNNRPLIEEFFVVIAGPLQHIWLILVSLILHSCDIISLTTATVFINFNIMILIFNLLPIWPLDGGKLLLILFSLFLPFVQAYKMIFTVSLAFLLSFILLTVIIAPFQLNIWVIISFLALSLFNGWRERHYVFMRFLIERYYGKTISFSKLKQIKVAPSERLINVLQRFWRNSKHLIIVDYSDSSTESFDENELLHFAFAEKKLLKRIADLTYFH